MSQTVTERLEALRQAERDYEDGERHAWGEQRLELRARLTRIHRQIAMLTEDQRHPTP